MAEQDPFEGMETGPSGEEQAAQRPEALDAERTVLGCCLLEPQALNDAMEYLEAGDFSLDSHQKIFSAIMELAETGNTVDLITLGEEIRRRKEMSTIGGPGYLASLTEGIPRNMSVENHCRIVKEKSNLRSVISICDLGMTQAADQSASSASIIGDIEERILEIAGATQQQKFTTIVDEVNEAGSIDAYLGKMFDPLALTGLPIGYKEIDDMLGGLKPKNLIILGARPSHGKSAMMVNIATNVTLKDPSKVLAVFSIEMGKQALYRRMMASVAGVNAQRAMSSWLGPEEKKRMASALGMLADCKIHIDDTSSITPMQMRAKCRRLKQKEGSLDLVIVDYLQMMSSGKKAESRTLEVSYISRSLKALSKELDVPVLALAMVGRGAEKRSNNRPMLSDLRESGDIEADADVVAFIHRESIYRPEEPEFQGLAEIIIAKNREGGTGMRQLAFLADTTRFETLERVY